MGEKMVYIWGGHGREWMNSTESDCCDDARYSYLYRELG